MKWDGAVFPDDDVGVAAGHLYPLTELFDIGHRGGESDDGYRLVKVEDDFFPYWAAFGVGKVVNLIHHHVGEVVQGVRVGVDHVAQDLSGHNDDVGVPIDGDVPGHEAHSVITVGGAEIVVFLVRQCLDRRGVEAAFACF